MTNKLKYSVIYTSIFKKQYKVIKKQGKDMDKLHNIIEKLANKEKLEMTLKNHNLLNDKYYKNCQECHIEPDWLLVYQYNDSDLILLLISTGTHSNLFK